MKLLVISVCAFAALAFAAFVWPTRYRYTEMRSEKSTLPVRINRFTGDAEMLLDSWHPLKRDPEPDAPQLPAILDLPDAELSQLKVTLEDVKNGRLKLSLYNGSRYDVRGLIVEISEAPAKELSQQEQQELDALIKLFERAGEKQEPITTPVELTERRKYRLRPPESSSCPPYEISHWTADLGFDTRGLPISITVVSATGLRLEQVR